MSRSARLKIEGEACVYHVCARVSGAKQGNYPLAASALQRKLIGLIRFYASGYQCEVIGFCIMGNHYHLIVKFHKPKKLSKKFLGELAEKFYPRSAHVVKLWKEEDWVRFEKRLFNLSEFMKSIQRSFTIWFNKKNTSRGSFWAERFKSSILKTPKAILECLLYVDLNPVRAGLVVHPEDFKGSSCYLRLLGKDSWLFSIDRVLGHKGTKAQILKLYRAYLYKRGAVRSKEGDHFIPDEVLRKMEKRDYKASGVYSKRLGYFTDGLVLGTKEQIEIALSELKKNGVYLRRKNPISHDDLLFTLREQRERKT